MEEQFRKQNWGIETITRRIHRDEANNSEQYSRKLSDWRRSHTHTHAHAHARARTYKVNSIIYQKKKGNVRRPVAATTHISLQF
jgi:hypothetical protein